MILVAGIATILLVNLKENMLQKHTPSTFRDLISISEPDLNKLDIAFINLLCAEGLPDTEDLDIPQALAVLDNWADVVRQSERKHLPQFQRNPAHYDNSLAKFKTVNIALTLKDDLGCDYNKSLITSGAMSDISSTRFFRNPSDIFLHGFTINQKGSCASFPVLMVAVGRRCGYPLFLVPAKGHLFFRWDDGTEAFNIEVAIEGVDSKSDDYYRTWPYPFNNIEQKNEKYLKSLTPVEELGVFALNRAMCLHANMMFKDAEDAYRVALKAFPDSEMVHSYLNAIKKEH